jgi:hypothetical protein
MKRLCFLSPDVDYARAVVRELKDDGIEERNIYALAKGDAELEDLPDAGPEADDFLPAFERGIGIGGLAGLFLGVAAMVFRSTSLIGGGGVLLVGLAGASLGGLLTGMAGASFPNSRLRIFEQEIEAGKILVMVDVPKNRVAHVNDLIRSVYPEVDVRGVEPRAPLIPR